MKKQYPKGELMAYYKGLTSWHFTIDSGYKRYYFDNDANITNIYIKGKIETNCIFWGMLPENPQIACYYYKKSDGKIEVLNSLMYENGLIKDKVQFFTGTGIGKDENLERKSREAILKNLTTTNNSTTTTENDNWKNQVAGKIIEEKDVENTYTFLNDGDISVRTRDNKTYTLKFWGATNYFEHLCGIYYIKLNLRDIFGNIAPNEETYFYYGYRFEEYGEDKGYKGRFPELIEMGQKIYSMQIGTEVYYFDFFVLWCETYFDKNGKPKKLPIDWTTMPIQETQYISSLNTKTILLMEK